MCDPESFGRGRDGAENKWKTCAISLIPFDYKLATHKTTVCGTLARPLGPEWEAVRNSISRSRPHSSWEAPAPVCRCSAYTSTAVPHPLHFLSPSQTGSGWRSRVEVSGYFIDFSREMTLAGLSNRSRYKVLKQDLVRRIVAASHLIVGTTKKKKIISEPER